MVKNILFICKYNRFRSKIAEYLFNKFNRNKNYKAKSAGLVKGSPLNYFQKRVCKKIGIILKDPTTGLSSKLLKWQDILIIVADDVPPSIFRESRISGKKLIVWKVRDVREYDEKKVINIARDIEGRVKKLVNSYA